MLEQEWRLHKSSGSVGSLDSSSVAHSLSTENAGGLNHETSMPPSMPSDVTTANTNPMNVTTMVVGDVPSTVKLDEEQLNPSRPSISQKVRFDNDDGTAVAAIDRFDTTTEAWTKHSEALLTSTTMGRPLAIDHPVVG